MLITYSRMVAIERIQNNRFGVVIAAALGLVTSSYFELEARGVLPNPLAAHSRLLAEVFSERAQLHVSVFVEPWARALTFALALLVGFVALRGDVGGPSRLLRLTYALGTLVLPIAAMVSTLVVQPLALRELCAPCLLESLFALAILECRSPTRPPLADAVGASIEGREAWRNRYSSPPSADA
jgi:hypothetical protein